MKKIKSLALSVLLFFLFLTPSVFAAPEYFSFAELKELAEEVGFESSLSPTIAAIGLAESGGNPNAHNDNIKTGDNSYGLMQINMINMPYYQLGNYRLKEFGLDKNQELFDPLTNMKAAKKIYDTSGLTAWSVYRRGTYKRYLQ